MDWPAIQSDFLNHCQRKRLSDHTLRAYRQDLTEFGLWSSRQGLTDPLQKERIEDWISHMTKRRLAPTTLKRRLACLKVLCRWLEDEERIELNPFIRLRTNIKVPKQLPKNLTDHELGLLLGNPRKSQLAVSDFSRATLALALEILYATGIRVGELCSIKLNDIDTDSGTITIKGKGNRERRVYLVEKNLKLFVKSYITERQRRSSLNEQLLIAPSGTALTPNQIRKSLHKFVEDRNIKRRITPHMFRHTTATKLLENGVDIRFVQKLLGHASISTTEIYTHVSDVKLHEAISGASLRKGVK